jgi:hypothetical protein
MQPTTLNILVIIFLLALAQHIQGFSPIKPWHIAGSSSSTTLNLFNFGKKSQSSASPKTLPRSEISKSSIASLSKRFTRLPPQAELEGKWDLLTKGLFEGDETKTANIVAQFPDVLRANPARLEANIKLLSETWGIQKASEVVLRNPNILTTPTYGYGSLSASLEKGNGNDIVAVSYLIAATRPAGPFLLAGLGLALAKAAIFGIN